MIRWIITTFLAVAAILSVPTVAANAATTAHHHISWGQIVKRCNHTHGCTAHVPAAIRHDLGIGNRPARWFIGDTSVIYVKYPHSVRRFTS